MRAVGKLIAQRPRGVVFVFDAQVQAARTVAAAVIAVSPCDTCSQQTRGPLHRQTHV
jgi:hypothetical protein